MKRNWILILPLLALVLWAAVGQLSGCEPVKTPAPTAEVVQANTPNPTEEPVLTPEPTEVQELVMDIAFMLGSRASDHLMMIKEKNDLSTEAMLAITRCLLAADSDYLVTILETIFRSDRMYDAAHELHLLERCKEYEADAAFFFEDAFWDTDAMDWYSIENLLREKAKEQNSKLN